MATSLMSLGLFAVALGRILVGAIVLIAGLAKLRADPNAFAKAILGYDLVPQAIAWILARYLPWLEVVSGGLLVLGFLDQIAVIMATGLFLLFSIAIASSLLRGREHDCGCSGLLGTQRVQWRLLYRDVALMGILLPVYAFQGGALSLGGWLGLGLGDNASASFVFTLLTILWVTSLSATVSLHLFARSRVVKTSSLEAE